MALPSFLLLTATAISTAALTASGPMASIDTSDSRGIVTATGAAWSNVAEVGDCVGFTLDVSGTEDGVAIEPIVATLTGPYEGLPVAGSVADGPPVGSLSATWTGSEWAYSADCVNLPVAGGFVWTLENPNDPVGLDLIIHDASIVEAVEQNAERPDDGDAIPDEGSGATDEDAATVDVSGEDNGAAARPQLAVTGANDSVLRSAAIGGATGLIGGLISLWIRALRKRKATEAASTDRADA